MPSRYDKEPFLNTGLPEEVCAAGWDAIVSRLERSDRESRYLLCVECYPGAGETEIAEELGRRLTPSRILLASAGYRTPQELEDLFARDLSNDPVFGRMSGATLLDFFDPVRLEELRREVTDARGLTILVGTGAALLSPEVDCLLYVDMARWELQLRQRSKLIGNLGLKNEQEDSAAAKYKRAFFLDWRVADRLKQKLLPRADFLLDANSRASPKMISGDVFRAALRDATQGPLRFVPFFDPGPWGGQWMRTQFDLPDGPPNYAWCFDCVPEENSLVLGFGDQRFEVPAQDLVFLQPRELMGESVHARFGLNFPIRFDLLDTMGGGNLSFQVHPLTEYIQDRFGMQYTQDESYYLLDAGADATVYLGLNAEVTPADFEADLREAQRGTSAFPVETYANRFPAKKHDHFLIPAGTPHCSGSNSMVLEISATPYIFTFKLWDWGRLGLDGRPRPIHLDHGLRNIQWERDTAWVTRELVNVVATVNEGEGWIEERTGLHVREFIETRRHWFTATVEHDTQGSVNVLNLVEGSEAVVESPEGSFAPFPVHYAETFVLPAAVGRYTLRPTREGERCATIKASIRGG